MPSISNDTPTLPNIKKLFNIDISSIHGRKHDLNIQKANKDLQSSNTNERIVQCVACVGNIKQNATEVAAFLVITRTNYKNCSYRNIYGHHEFIGLQICKPVNAQFETIQFYNYRVGNFQQDHKTVFIDNQIQDFEFIRSLLFSKKLSFYIHEWKKSGAIQCPLLPTMNVDHVKNFTLLPVPSNTNSTYDYITLQYNILVRQIEHFGSEPNESMIIHGLMFL